MKKQAKRLIRGGRSGRRIYGGIYELSDGKEVYLAFRQRKEIFRSGEKNVSSAADKGIACWAIDYDTLLDMRNNQVFLIGVYVRDEGDIYLTHYDNFFDDRKATVRNYESRGGALQKYLPIQHFAKIGNSIAA
ncbi:hypothetical protein [Phaeobacter gallaeciensis]|uniref:hypothetical protein n=1 Tax=Phaeobacter gallaeciensis TaxID=60890 RepID=UPI0023801C9B|nr:hypothetical protein [Phaeobacter gallaeciensis]